MGASCSVSSRRLRSSQAPMQVPPPATVSRTARSARDRVRAEARAMRGVSGYTTAACSLPRTTANGVPSGSLRIAATAARCAACSFSTGQVIELEQSMTSTCASTGPPGGRRPRCRPRAR